MTEETPAQTRYRLWLASQGVKFYDGLRFGHHPDTGAGIFADSDIQAEDGSWEVVRVPASLAITPVTCRVALTELITASSASSERRRQFQDVLDRFEQLDMVVLYLFIVRKLLTLQESPAVTEKDAMKRTNLSPGSSALVNKHAEYVRVLPEDVITPLHFRGRELDLLTPTALHGSTLLRRAHTRERCGVALTWLRSLGQTAGELAQSSSIEDASVAGGDPAADLRSTLNLLSTWAQYVSCEPLPADDRLGEVFRDPEREESEALRLWQWAETVYLSRCFPARLAYPGVQQDIIIPEGRGKVGTWRAGESMGGILIPGLDSLNHRRGEKAEWIAHREEGPRSTDGAQPSDPSTSSIGDQVQDFIVLKLSTGIKAGDQVFNNYGAKTNEELLGSYGFTEPGGPDDAVPLVIGRLYKPALPTGDTDTPAKAFYWTRETQEIPEHLYSEIIAQLKAAGAFIHGLQYEDETEHKLIVLDQLEQMFEQKCAKLEDFLNYARSDHFIGRGNFGLDNFLPARKEIRRHIAEYLKGQAEICRQARECITQKMAVLEAQWEG